jgi:thiol-disulfide isomerase/thioredoxin
MKRAAFSLVLTLTLTAAAAAQSTSPNIIRQVRDAIAKSDFALGEKLLADYRAEKGEWTPEALEALSWLGRGSLAADRLDQAERYARETHELALAELEGRGLDDERNLPIALGAAIEVQAHVSARRGNLSEAVYTLERQLETYRDTSIRTRIQKNVNLLTLEGKAAPAYEVSESIGGRAPSLADLKGRPALLFFWAHWCPDCKAMAPTLARLQQMYGDKGLAVIGPTQRYGFVGGGRKAEAAEEMAHIARVRTESYGQIADFSVPVGQETFKVYGCSTTPTLVLVDRQGVVRMYRPGQMPFEELEPKVRAVVEGTTSSNQR